MTAMPAKRDLWSRAERVALSPAPWAWAVMTAILVLFIVILVAAWSMVAPGVADAGAAVKAKPPAPRKPAAAAVGASNALTLAAEAMMLEATGYSQSMEEGTADGITASMLPVARGMAAADPAVLPPGTVLLVPDYGYALVGDVGSAIKGSRLDLFFPTRQEALQWGRRMVEVRVVRLGEGSVNGY